MSLLTIVQNVVDETLILNRPTSVINNTDSGVRQFFSFTKKVLLEIAEYFDWEAIVKEQTFVTNGTGSYPISTIISDGDYGRPLQNTSWDRTNDRRVRIVTPAKWQELVSSTVTPVGIGRYARARGGNIIILPDNTGETIVLEYVSKFLVESSGGARKLTFTDDTDVSIFPEHLVELGLKAYVKAEHALDATQDFDLFYSTMEDIASQEKFAPDVKGQEPYGKSVYSKYYLNVPDTGVGQ